MDQQATRTSFQDIMVTAYEGGLLVVDLLLLLLKLLYYSGKSIYRLFVPVGEKNVAGEIVLITGAGHGIGKELALKYGCLGATVVCWDLNQQRNEETVDEIRKCGGTQAYAYKCDVSKREEVFAVAEKVKKEVGNVTILINNAGIMPTHAFLDHTPEEIKQMFDVNVLSHFWTIQAFLPVMLEKNYGHIVAISSIAGIVGQRNLVPYSASKFAVRGLMEALHEEIRTASKDKISNINFTTVYPYMVDTGLCKKPKIRFENLMSLVPPKMAAAEIVKAQRRNYLELTIPLYFLYINTFCRCTADKFFQSITDFIGSGVEADS